MPSLRTLTLAVLAPAALLAPLVTATPAAADSNACTHHWSGPQICIDLKGRNGWNSVTAIWKNPPKSVKARKVTLYVNGRHYDTATARRSGGTLRHHWSSFQTKTGTKLCVKFRGSQRMACEKSKYIGDRAG